MYNMYYAYIGNKPFFVLGRMWDAIKVLKILQLVVFSRFRSKIGKEKKYVTYTRHIMMKIERRINIQLHSLGSGRIKSCRIHRRLLHADWIRTVCSWGLRPRPPQLGLRRRSSRTKRCRTTLRYLKHNTIPARYIIIFLSAGTEGIQKSLVWLSILESTHF